MKKGNDGVIKFHFLESGFHFSDRKRLKTFLLQQLKREKKKVEAINYIFCDDAYLLAINRQYLQHNTYTDIITFELSLKGHALVADIYISVERVKDNARQFGTSIKNELHRVVFHGILHLAGFKDKTSGQRKVMRAEEEKWLRQYFVSRETQS